MENGDSRERRDSWVLVIQKWKPTSTVIVSTISFHTRKLGFSEYFQVWKYILREDFYLLRKSLFSTLISMSSLGAWRQREERKSVVSCYLVSFLLKPEAKAAVLFQATYFTLMVVIRLSIRESLQHRLQPPFLNKVSTNIFELMDATFTIGIMKEKYPKNYHRDLEGPEPSKSKMTIFWLLKCLVLSFFPSWYLALW